MRQSILSFISPSGQPPGHLSFWRLFRLYSRPSGSHLHSNGLLKHIFLIEKFFVWSTNVLEFNKLVYFYFGAVVVVVFGL